jgi:hypothetical protein
MRSQTERISFEEVLFVFFKYFLMVIKFVSTHVDMFVALRTMTYTLSKRFNLKDIHKLGSNGATLEAGLKNR